MGTATRQASSAVREDTREAHVAGDGENRKDYSLTIQAPGVRQDDLRVSTEGDFLIVRGATTVGTTTYGVNRIFRLPADANIDDATANHSDGVLELLVPVKGAPKQSPSEAANREPTPPTQPLTMDTKSGSESEGQVLTEAEPDEANVQLPQEQTDELQMEGTDADKEAVGEMDAYLAGYERALDDMKVPLPSKQSSVTDVQSEVDDAGLSGQEHTPSEQAVSAVSSEHPVAAAPKADDMNSDWDDLLDDLSEMGFENRQSNLAALEKHSGSIKQAVKELVHQRQLD